MWYGKIFVFHPTLPIRKKTTLKPVKLISSLSPLFILQEISSCPSIPEIRDDAYCRAPQIGRLAKLQASGSSSGAVSQTSDTRGEDDIEKKLTLAASCIQEVLALHRRDSTATRNTASLFKVPSVPASKKRTTTNVLQGESSKHLIEKFIKPRPLTPLPVKKAKTSVSDKSSTPRIPSTSGTGRTNSGISRR
jgi:hypothetical protein